MQTSEHNYLGHSSVLPNRNADVTGRVKVNSSTPVAVLVTLLNILAILFLYTLRQVDDNRLTSWQWLMDGQQVFILSLMLTGILLFCWHIRVNALRINAPLGLFLLAFLTGMVFWTEPEVIIDSARYFTQAKYLSEYGVIYFIREWGNSITSWTDLPLVPLIYGFVFKIFGESRLVIQLVTLSMFAGTIVLTYYIGKTLWDEMTGFYGGVLLLGMPFLLTQVPLMLVDVPSMFFLTLAVWTTLQVIRQGSIYWIVLAAISITMAMLSKYSVWLMLSVLPVLLLTCHHFNWQLDAKRLMWVLYGTGLLLAPFIILKIDLLLAQLQLLSAYQLPGLRRWQESQLSTFFFQIHPFISLAALASVYHAIHQRDWHYLPIVWMWLLIFIVGINRSRYVIIALPMLALMAAYAIRLIRNHEIRHYLLLSIVMTSLVLGIGAYRPFLQSTSATNLQAAGRFLDQLNVDAVEVIVLPQINSTINPLVSIPALDLFTHQKLVYQPAANPISPQDKQALSTSPLRFSWEFKLPDFYRDNGWATNKAIAVIASHPRQTLPQNIRQRLTDYQVSARFTRTEGVFRYRTDVTVYELKRASLQDKHNLSQRG